MTPKPQPYPFDVVIEWSERETEFIRCTSQQEAEEIVEHYRERFPDVEIAIEPGF